MTADGTSEGAEALVNTFSRARCVCVATKYLAEAEIGISVKIARKICI
jgi:hypothetical protein